MTWTNKQYTCKEHTSDNKWPTVEGGVCFKLNCADGRGAHYFDNHQQATALGWRKSKKKVKVKK